MEDSRSIRKLKKGDSEAFGVLFDKYYDRVFHYFCYRITDRELAYDFTQEVFLRVLKSIDCYRHYGKFENYLYVIAGNLLRDMYRKKKMLFLDEMEEAVVEDGYARSEQQLMFKEAIHRLPEREREIIILRYYEELKIKDIARIMELNLSTVKYHLKKGLSMLKELIEE